ncbi:STAS domain-containing protein [Streptomyces sp. NPDC004111]|uniref:STAS domain-containing protein n=1 Tax=Streptomyces sp. NPDC004111 TaxID=3364690 RepID=UPI0036995E0E
MTTFPRDEEAPDAPAAPHSLHIRTGGVLDYDTSTAFLVRVDHALGKRPAHVTELHLDCRDLETIDSMGLSTLLQIHRTATRHHLALHLDNRPARLERMLTVTGTLDHLTRPAVAEPTGSPADPAASGDEPRTGTDEPVM